MSASEQAKAAGLKSLAQVSRLTGKRATSLDRWHKEQPQLFEIVLLGAKAKLDQLESEKEQ